MENEEKNVVKKSNKNIILYIFMFILVLCLGLGIGMFITTDSKKDNTDTKEETKENNDTNSKENEVIELDPEGSVVTGLLDNLKSYGCYNPTDDYLIDKEFKASDFTNDKVFAIAMTKLDMYSKVSIYPDLPNDSLNVTESQLDKAIDQIFGKSYNFTHKQYNILCPFWNYDKASKTYLSPTGTGCGGVCLTYSKVKTIKAEQVGNNINVYMRKIFYGSSEESFKIYSDYKRTNVIYEGTGDQIPDDLVEKGQLYKVVFTLEDGNYIFTSAAPIAG